jgi:hypothetical protein
MRGMGQMLKEGKANSRKEGGANDGGRGNWEE